MKNGISRFEYYLNILADLLHRSEINPLPGEWLYKNNARTTLFMLEALSRLYSGLHNEKLFFKLKDQFKELEDILGDIDNYDVYAKFLANDPEIPEYIITYLLQRKEEHINQLNKVLTDNNWTGKKANRIEKIRKKLADADWMKNKEETAALKKFYKGEVKDIREEFTALKSFTDVEEHLHDLRRKVRWLSIYAQALRGAIQLSDTSAPDPATDKYLTPEIINSPFNDLPARGNNSCVLLLEKKYFLSLSWFINELGILKDSGLAIVAVNEAMDHKLEQNAELVLSVRKAAAKGQTIEDILRKATDTSHTFFNDNILDKMVLNISCE